MMRIILAAGVAFYLLSTVAMAGGVVMVTLWAYGVSMKPLADTVSAAILNGSAATLLWLAFFGGFDMFFTVWQMMQNRQQAELHRKEKEGWEEERKARAKAQEEERKTQAQTQVQALEEQRRYHQAILDHLAAEQEENRRERAQFLAMMARFMEIAEGMANRNGNRNGSGDSGGGNGDVNGSGGSGSSGGVDGSGGSDDGDNGSDGDGGAHTAPGDTG